MKKIFRLFICLLGVLTITSCSNTNLEKVDYDKFSDLIENKETFVLYIGSTSCHNCTEFSPKLESVVNKYDIKNVKYVEIDNLDEDDRKEFNKIINVSGTPTVAFIEDGEEKSMTNRINGNVSEDKIIARFKSNGYIE